MGTPMTSSPQPVSLADALFSATQQRVLAYLFGPQPKVFLVGTEDAFG